MGKVPVGFRFEPTAEDLLYYLRSKVKGQPLPLDLVTECDIYDDKEPWKILDKNSKEIFYVITKLKRKTKLRIERIAGCGTWDGRQTNEIKDHNRELIGFDKYFVFGVQEDLRADIETNGHWTMHEFSLVGEEFNEYVICVIRNKDSKKNLEEQVRGNKPHAKRQGNDSQRSKQRSLISSQKCQKQKKMQITSTMDNIDVKEKKKIGNPCLVKSNLSERTQELGSASSPNFYSFANQSQEYSYRAPFPALPNLITSSSYDFGTDLMDPCMKEKCWDQSSVNVESVQPQNWAPTMPNLNHEAIEPIDSESPSYLVDQQPPKRVKKKHAAYNTKISATVPVNTKFQNSRG